MSFVVKGQLRGLGVFADEKLDDDDLIDICNEASKGTELYKGRNTIWSIGWRGRQMAVKSFGTPWGVKRWIYGSLRASKAKRSFKNACVLTKCGLGTPRPIAYLEFGTKRCLTSSFYMCEDLSQEPGLFTIRDVLLDNAWPEREGLLVEFGRFTLRLHQHGICHRDYSPGNILVTKPSPTKSQVLKNDHSNLYMFQLVDLNRMSFGPLSDTQRMDNLRMLWADDRDMAVIVRGYADEMGVSEERLFEIALNRSRLHKERASREERLKKAVRSCLSRLGRLGT